jgi:hypothetical protein
VKLGKRQFLKFLAGAVCSGSFLYSMTDFLESRPSSRLFVRKVVIFFPPEKSYSDYQVDCEKWMDKKVWEEYLLESINSGTVTDYRKNIFPNRVEFFLRFSNMTSYFSYLTTLESLAKFDPNMRRNLGYQLGYNRILIKPDGVFKNVKQIVS